MTRSVGGLLWEPSPETIASAELTRYMRSLGLGFTDYHELWRWSVTNIDGFWESIWRYFDVAASRPYTRVLGRRNMPGAEWFPGAELSYAEHVFRGHPDDEIAILHASELRPLGQVTWRELRELTAQIAGGLRAVGVEAGDRVAAYLPNVPETVASFLACASIGAVWSSCAPEFGTASVVERFTQIEPKVLLACDGYRYGGKDFDRTAAIAELSRSLPTVEQTFILPYLGRTGNWPDLLVPGELTFAHVPFDHPLWILYSSGTTGLPKPIVHGHGGILLEHMKKLRLHLDARRGDRIFWFTTTGWMMWNFLVSGLLTEAAIVLYDGSPAASGMTTLWHLAEQTETTCFGTSAAFIAASMKANVHPRRGRNLTHLRSVGSTGSPLSPEAFRWIYDELGDHIWLFSTSGGTDVCSAFVGGVPTLPVHEGELQARSLGARVEAFNTHGHSIVNQVGELVLTEPMPSMPLYLWGDDDGSRYRETYFSMFPGVWQHGDWIEITPRGSAVIYGRSDATINRDGVRIGTSEIYRSVLAVPAVVDALAVDVAEEGTTGRILLFVVLDKGATLTPTLGREIKSRIRNDCSSRHVPDEVIQVADLPRTLSGKLLEVPVKRILLGVDPDQVASRDSLANPQALDAFAALRRR